MLDNTEKLGKIIIPSSDLRALDPKLSHEAFQLVGCSSSISGQHRSVITPNTCLRAALSLCCSGLNTQGQGIHLIRTKVEKNPNNQNPIFLCYVSHSPPALPLPPQPYYITPPTPSKLYTKSWLVLIQFSRLIM